MNYKIIDRAKNGDVKQYGRLNIQQYDDSITVKIEMTNNNLYPSDILKTIKDNGIIYYFGSSTLTKRNKAKNTKEYIATYWKKKPVW